MNKIWELYYRGCIGKWVDLFKKDDQKKIDSSIFKNYLELRSKLDDLLKEINSVEEKLIQNYPLFKSIPTSSSPSENEIYVKEMIIYINSKNT